MTRRSPSQPSTTRCSPRLSCLAARTSNNMPLYSRLSSLAGMRAAGGFGCSFYQKTNAETYAKVLSGQGCDRVSLGTRSKSKRLLSSVESGT